MTERVFELVGGLAVEHVVALTGEQRVVGQDETQGLDPAVADAVDAGLDGDTRNRP